MIDRLADRSARRLWLYGIGMLFPAGYFVWSYPLLASSRTLTDIGKLSQYRAYGFAGFVGGTLLLFVLYLLALRESRRLPARRALPAVFVCGGLLALVMAAMYPVTAIDIFVYAVRSRLFTTYGANPIAVYARDYPQDPWFRFATAEWAGYTSPYGPLWNLVAAPLTAVAGENITIALIGFKLLAVAELLASGTAIAYTLAATKRVLAATGALFFLWNPLVIWEIAGNGHNDILMTLAVLLALLAWEKRRDGLVIPLLIVSAMIKYVSVLIIPLAIVALWRRAAGWRARLRIGLWSAALSALVLAVSLYPFYDVTAMINIMDRASMIFGLSVPALAITVLRALLARRVEQWVRLGGLGIVLITIGRQLGALWIDPWRLPRAAFEVMFVFLLVAVSFFHGWYLVWLVGLAALLPWGWPAWRTIAWTIGSLAGITLTIWIEAWWHPGWATIQNIAIPLMMGGPVLLTLAELAYRAVDRPRPPMPELSEKPLLPPRHEDTKV